MQSVMRASISRWAILCSVLLPVAVNAGIIYDEALSGDLAAQDPITLVLSAGSNSVLGSGELRRGTGGDGFQFSFEEGLILSGITYFVTGRDIADNTFALSLGFFLREGSHGGAQLSASAVDVFTPSAVFFTDVLPMSEGGTYGFTPTYISSGAMGPPEGSWTYEIELRVSDPAQVPLPGSYSIFGLGLVVLLWWRRRLAGFMAVTGHGWR